MPLAIAAMPCSAHAEMQIASGASPFWKEGLVLMVVLLEGARSAEPPFIVGRNGARALMTSPEAARVGTPPAAGS